MDIEDENEKLKKTLKNAKKDDFKDPFKDHPDLKRELLIGQLRNIKAKLQLIERKRSEGEELDDGLDEYNRMREKILKDIDNEGFTYNKGEEDDDKYINYDL